MNQEIELARLVLPKQRATRHIGIVLICRMRETEKTYSTHLFDVGTDDYFEGHYDFDDFASGFEDFQERCEKWLSYSAGVYELFN